VNTIFYIPTTIFTLPIFIAPEGISRLSGGSVLVYNKYMKRLPRVALIIESTASYGRELIRGIVRYSRMHGPWYFPWVFYNDDICYVERMRKGIDLDYLRRWRPDGIITRDAGDISKLTRLKIPLFVAVGMNPPEAEWNAIITDDLAIGKMAAEHLLERGFRHFGFCGLDDMVWSRQRCESFGRRIMEAGFKVNNFKQPRSRTAREWDKEEVVLMKWLRSLPKPVGIMACNDRRGQHITEACAKAKLEVPYEVAIIGVDNDEHVCDISNPPLSSVALDVEKAGFRACELLDKMLTGKKLKPQKVIVHPTRVVTRQSTEIIAVEDVLVSQALYFIHQNASNPIQVSDVAKALKVSRSAINDKFMKILRRSVYNEIKRVRTDLICRMLIDTDLSVSDIAFKLGYNNANHIARYFKEKVKISPLEYRRLHGHK
jgi:LacI family transcriptional regulator